MNADAYAEMIKQAAFSTGKHLVLKFVVGKLPFMGNIFFGPIVGFFVGKVLEIAILKTEMGIFFTFIDLRTSQQGREFAAAALANIEAQKSSDPKVRANAEKKQIDAFRVFVKLA